MNMISLRDQNHLFQSIPEFEWQRLLPSLEPIDLPLGMTLCEPGMKMSHVYFPSTAITSLIHEFENGSSAEFASVGNEGLLGFSIFMGGGTTPSTAIVKSSGFGYRMKSELLLKEFEQRAPIMRLLLRFTQALITQVSQTGVCNRHHLVEQQFCRFLLESLDRLPNNEITMTHELIARLLGVRREGITEAALKMQANGLIKYSRGHITVLDRHGIESCSCECYKVVKSEYNRLLSIKMAA